MYYKDNIARRKHLEKMVCDGEKISKEEQLWCISNPLYNEKYQEPRLQKDIIKLLPNKTYNIKIVLEQLKNEGLKRIIPIISIVGKKGNISINHSTNDNSNRSVKALGVLIDKEIPTSCFSFNSESGLMSIAYECFYYKSYSNIDVVESSYSANLSFAMIKTELADNKIRYACKSPLRNEFDALVFTIEWQ